MQVIQIAQLCHEANAAYCRALGDNSQPAWSDAPEWQRQSAIKGVEFHLENPHATESASHESWLEQKRKEGWTYGPTKDPASKQHPCFVPFTALPAEQQVKDAIFKGIVDATRRLVAQNSAESSPHEFEVRSNKLARVEIDRQIQQVKSLPGSRERSICITKLQEAVMWLGMDLKRLNEPNPYPNSKDPSNTKIEPTADGLKL